MLYISYLVNYLCYVQHPGQDVVVMQFNCNLTKAKDMVKNMTDRATVLLYAIFWSRQGRFTLNCAELFVVCLGSTGVDHVDGVARRFLVVVHHSHGAM